MTPEEFREIIERDPVLAVPLKQAAAAAHSQQFVIGGGVGEAAALLFMYHVARATLTCVGLPWLSEAVRYSEMWRLKFHNWIDEECRKEGVDPDQAETAGEALRKELENTTDPTACAAWEQLSNALSQPPGGESS